MILHYSTANQPERQRLWLPTTTSSRCPLPPPPNPQPPLLPRPPAFPLPNLFSKCVCPLLNCFLFHIISCHGDLISRIIWISLYLLIWEHFIFFIVFLSIFKTNNHLICVSADYVCPSIEVGSCVGETNQWETIINLPSTISRICGWHSTPARNTHHIQTSFFLFFFLLPFFFFFLFPLTDSSAGQLQVPFKIIIILPTDMYNFGHITFSDREGTRVKEVQRNIFFL